MSCRGSNGIFLFESWGQEEDRRVDSEIDPGDVDLKDFELTWDAIQAAKNEDANETRPFR